MGEQLDKASERLASGRDYSLMMGVRRFHHRPPVVQERLKQILRLYRCDLPDMTAEEESTLFGILHFVWLAATEGAHRAFGFVKEQEKVARSNGGVSKRRQGAHEWHARIDAEINRRRNAGLPIDAETLLADLDALAVIAGRNPKTVRKHLNLRG